MLTKPDLDWLEFSFLPKLAQKVKDELGDKLDSISTKLDKFVGDIRDKRTAQELHAHEHDHFDKRLRVVEKHLHLPSVVD